jgi:pyridoxal phosphate enzyme (YggS family)
VRLVAVSKTKPLTMLQAARTAADQLVFGENYVQELIDKVQHVNNAEENFVGGKDIQWHFIGALQSNKVNALIHAFENRMDKLVVETVGSQKLANKLNTAVAAATTNTDDTTTTGGTKLKVFVQVNTSGEDSKSGVKPNDEVVELCRHIYTSCPHLMLQGLMTIGAPGDESAFDVLSECRTRVSEALLMDLSDEETEEHAALELSMGMSDDFEVAIAKGSTNVRVGSTIFGARNYANK